MASSGNNARKPIKGILWLHHCSGQRLSILLVWGRHPIGKG